MKIVSLLLSLLSIMPLHAAVTRPNIVIILADDLGYGEVQCYNPERGKVPTPEIDRLAAAAGNGGWNKSPSPAPATPVLLFHLADDLGATIKLAADQPQRVIAMLASFAKLIAAGRSTPGLAQENDVEIRGYVLKANPFHLKKKLD